MSSFPISSSNATLSLPASPSLFDCCKLHKLNQSRWKIRSISFDFDGMQGAVHIMLEYTVNKNGIPLIRHVTREVGQHFPAVKANLQFGELCCWKNRSYLQAAPRLYRRDERLTFIKHELDINEFPALLNVNFVNCTL